MSKISVVANVVVLSTGLKLEDVKLLAKYKPEALEVRSGEKNENVDFVIGVGKQGYSKYGINFEYADAEGNAILTFQHNYSGDATEVKGKIADELGIVKRYVGMLEDSVTAAAAEVRAERSALIESIEMA